MAKKKQVAAVAEPKSNALTHGEIALLKQLHKRFTPDDVKEILDFLIMGTGMEKDQAYRAFYIFKNNYRDEGDYENIGEDVDREMGWEDYSDAHIALAMHFDTIPDLIEKKDYHLHGLEQFEYEEKEFYCGTHEEAEEAAKKYVEEQIDDSPEHFNQSFLQDYLTVPNSDEIAQEEAEAIFDGADDDYILSESGLEDEYQELSDEIDSLTDEISDLDNEIEEWGSQIEELEEALESSKGKKKLEIENQIEKLREEIADAEQQRIIKQALLDKKEEEKESFIDNAKEKAIENKAEEIEKEIDDDPFQYFVKDHGLYSAEDFFKARFVRVDSEKAAAAAIDEDGIAHYLAHYDNEEETVEYNGVTYYIYRTN